MKSSRAGIGRLAGAGPALLTEAADARRALWFEGAHGHLPVPGWLGSCWMGVMQPASLSLRVHRGVCVSS